MNSLLTRWDRARGFRRTIGLAIAATLLMVPLPSGAADSATGSSAIGSSATGSHWRWPTPPPHRITRDFQAPATRYSAGHRGIDIAASVGEAVIAPADGTVYFVGRVVDRSVITLAVGDDLLVSIEPVDAQVPLHTRVAAGSQVGAVSRGGHCDGSCVHVGVRFRGQYVSPLLYLGGLERAVLLPVSRRP